MKQGELTDKFLPESGFHIVELEENLCIYRLSVLEHGTSFNDNGDAYCLFCTGMKKDCGYTPNKYQREIKK